MGGAVTLSDVERRDLALETLATYQLSPTSAASPEDPLHQIGLQRRRIGGALGLTGGAGAGFELDTVRGRGGEIRRQQWRIGSDKGPAFHLSLVNADAGFSRFQDLTAEERSWAGAMRGMRRMEFGGDRMALAGGLTQLGLLQIGDGGARARRMSLGFSGARWSVQALSQRVDDGFKRLADLTEGDRKLFGAERGIARDSLALGYRFGSNQTLNISQLSLRAAGGVAERRQIELAGGPRLQLRLTTGRVDSKFDRIADLLEPDRNAFAPQRGTRWSDLLVSMKPARWLTTENQWIQSANLDSGRHGSQLRNLWTLQFSPRTKLVLLRNLISSPSGTSGRSRSLTQSVRLEQWLTKSLFFTGFRELVRNGVGAGPETTGNRLALHVNTAPSVKLQASADYSTAASPDGKSERVLQWKLGLPLRPGLALQSQGERHLVNGLPGSQSMTLGLAGKVARACEMALTLNTARAAQGPGSHDLGLRLTFAGLPETSVLRESHLVLSIGDTAGLASAVPVPKPADGKPATAKTPCRPKRRLDSVALETKFRGRPLTFGYAAASGTVGGLIYYLASSAKSRLQWELLRELRDLGRTSLVAHQRWVLRAALSRLTRLSFVREVNPEQSPGKLLVGHSVTRAEALTRLGKLDVSSSFSWDRDRLAGVSTQLLGLGISGTVDPLSNLQVSYSGRSGRPDPAIPDHLVKLAFERKPDELLKVALSAEWRGWGDRRSDELAYQLDLTAVF